MLESRFCNDPFAPLHQNGSLQERLNRAHQILRKSDPAIARIGVALFDETMQQASTFLASPSENNPLQNYQVELSQCNSLIDTVRSGQVRIINDLSPFAQGENEHSRKIWELGMRSSYTLAVFEQDNLRGFIFLDATERNYFRPPRIERIALFTQLLAQIVLGHQAKLRTLVPALRVISSMMHYRDPETGNHLERMARFSQLIARELATRGKARLNDEEIDYIFRFAPLHDIGKVGIPDRILLKPERLNAREWSVMKTHSGIGRSLIDKLIEEFGFDNLPSMETLRQITELHHEKIDGSGYPHGLSGQQVPLAARIVCVSDIFDALTCERPYKKAWSNQAALAELLQLAEQRKADPDCVRAIKDRLPEVERIQQVFSEA